MQTLHFETKIAAPMERCFLLSLSIDLHTVSTAQTSERAVAGVTHGLIAQGEHVTWQAKHFGVWLTHEACITRYERPYYFQDAMVRGMFKSFEHDHRFLETADGTLMQDTLRFAAPLGPLGLLAEHLVLRRYFQNFLQRRNAVIRDVAESEDEWKRFLPSIESTATAP